MLFVVFSNEDGNPEFAVQLDRDAKGLTHQPDKRYGVQTALSNNTDID
jgi:hypothetical protein